MRRNKHHLRARSHGGRNEKSNILLIKVERHEAYHKLFGNRSLESAIRLLIRILRAKKHGRIAHFAV